MNRIESNRIDSTRFDSTANDTEGKGSVPIVDWIQFNWLFDWIGDIAGLEKHSVVPKDGVNRTRPERNAHTSRSLVGMHISTNANLNLECQWRTRMNFGSNRGFVSKWARDVCLRVFPLAR